MPNDKNDVYWDSCVFIDLLQQTKGRYGACNFIHERAERGELRIVTSAVAIAEVVKLSNTSISAEEQSKKILDYFENPYIVIRQVDRETAKYAHRLCKDHGLIHLDAIHLATALLAEMEVLYTYDSQGKRRKGLLRWNEKFGTPPLKIINPPNPPPPPPPPPQQPSLFEADGSPADADGQAPADKKAEGSEANKEG